MLRLLTILSALFLATAASATTLWVDAARDGYLNLRTGPSTHYKVIGQMPHATRVEVLRAPGKWLKVRHASGAIGWAHGGFLSEHKPRAVHDRDPGYDKHRTYRVEAPHRGFTHLRDSPSRHAAVLGKVPHGTKVRILDKQGPWYKLRRKSTVGWVHGRFLTEEWVEPDHKGRDRDHDNGHTDKWAGQRYWVYAPGYGGLNLRNGPGTQFPVLKTMNNRDRAVELRRKGSWILLRHQSSGQVGWAHSDYLATQDPGYVPGDRRKGGQADGGRKHDGKNRFGAHDPDRDRDHGYGRSFDTVGEALAACIGRQGDDLQNCIIGNVARID